MPLAGCRTYRSAIAANALPFLAGINSIPAAINTLSITNKRIKKGVRRRVSKSRTVEGLDLRSLCNPVSTWLRVSGYFHLMAASTGLQQIKPAFLRGALHKTLKGKVTHLVHDLRHRFAVDYLKNKVGSIYELPQHLGHTSVKTTEMYLDYLSAPEKRAVMFGR